MPGVVSWVTATAMILQPQLLAAESFVPTDDQPPVRSQVRPERSVVPQDIQLGEGGVLAGQVVDAQGAPVTESTVSLQTAGKEVARVHTGPQGQFRVASLQGGTYQVVAQNHRGVYRFWAPRTAPPAAIGGLTIVSGQDVLRGQYGPRPGNAFTAAGQWIAEHPIITAAGIATAIAVPLALDDDDDPPATP